jgi:tetratricopeptide (TPR) repeat protein
MAVKVPDKLNAGVNAITAAPIFRLAQLKDLRVLTDLAVRHLDLIDAGGGDTGFTENVTTLAECWEHVGRPDGEPLLKRGPDVLAVLPPAIDRATSVVDKDRVRARIRYVAAYAALQSQSGEFGSSLDKLDFCLKLVEGPGGLIESDYKCYGLQGHLLVDRAQILHRTGRNDEAIRDLHRALSAYSERAREFSSWPLAVDSDVAQERTRYLQWMRFRTAEALRTLAYVHYRQGTLRRAMSALAVAHLLILIVDEKGEVVSDDLTRASLVTLEAAIQRAMDDSPPQLDILAVKLDDARRTFETFGHRSRTLRANYELALVHRIRPNSYDTVKRYVETVRSLASVWDDQQWLCYADICLSRAARREEALRLARDAVNRAERHHLDLCEIEGLMAEGEACLLDPADTAAARQAFFRVLSFKAIENGSNPRWRMQCEAQIARSFVLDGDLAEADRWLFKAKRWSDVVEQVRTLQLLKDIETLRQKSAGDDFVIRVGQLDTYEALEDRFRRWVIRQARGLYGTDTAVAGKLDISRITLAKWARKLAMPPERSRRGRKRRSS